MYNNFYIHFIKTKYKNTNLLALKNGLTINIKKEEFSEMINKYWNFLIFGITCVRTEGTHY